jgi:signal peptidase I
MVSPSFAARLNLVSPENSPDHPLGSVAPESPVAENPWAAGPSEAPSGVVAFNGTHSEVIPSEVVPGEVVPAETVPMRPDATEFPRSTLAEWVITILLLLFLTTFLVQAFVIPTGSMEDTLLIGDHLLVDKLAYAPSGPISKYILPYTEVKRGDIIVFRYPTDIQQTFVKRCMGVPGDRIHIVNKQVYINGKALVEPYKYNKTDYIDSYRDNFPGEPNDTLERGAIEMLQNNVENGEVVVPPGSYFAMGDNRDSSLDSRYWGFVPRQNIIGKPLIIYWSYDRPSDQLNSNSVTFPQMLDLAEHFFSKTRWSRAFMLIHGYPVQ